MNLTGLSVPDVVVVVIVGVVVVVDDDSQSEDDVCVCGNTASSLFITTWSWSTPNICDEVDDVEDEDGIMSSDNVSTSAG